MQDVSAIFLILNSFIINENKRCSKYNSQSTSLKDIQEMVHNNFGDLDDKDQKEEVIDLITELV